MAVHCAALPGEILESELFGAEAGAYTGADEARPGLLESLSGGTLLLDAIDQLPFDGQAKLLQVLETGTFRRLAGVELERVNLRFLASTSVDLAAASRPGASVPISTIACAQWTSSCRRSDAAPCGGFLVFSFSRTRDC